MACNCGSSKRSVKHSSDFLTKHMPRRGRRGFKRRHRRFGRKRFGRGRFGF